MEKKEFKCMVDAEIVNKLNLALQLTNEELDDVVETLLINYIRKCFLKAAQEPSMTDVKTTTAKTIISGINDSNHGKANRKIPIWAQRVNQNNHKIIKAFLLIEKENGEVSREKLTSRCSNKDLYPETYVNDFNGNFAQMKTDASNSHGKVFVMNGDRVEIWDEVMETLMKYKDEFIKSESVR